MGWLTLILFIILITTVHCLLEWSLSNGINFQFDQRDFDLEVLDCVSQQTIE